MIRCIIVEDETLAQDVLKSHLKQIENWELTGVCRNAREAQALLASQEVDVMFLDIRLPGMNGLHFLRSLPDPPLVILTTAYAEYAVESYEFSVIDYLLKPISFERFAKAIDRISNDRLHPAASLQPAAASLEPAAASPDNAAAASIDPSAAANAKSLPTDHIFIRSNAKFFKVNFAEILFIEGMKDYCKVHTQEFTLVTHQTMNELEKTLPSRQFLRAHKSYIVAITHIRAIYGNSIEIGKATIPIGINYKEEVMRLIGRP